MNKAIGIGAIFVLVAAIAGGVYYVSQNIDGFVKEQIEIVGTEAVGTQVAVQEVKLNLREGGGRLSGLTIANPEGFSADSVFQMSGIEIAIDPTSLANDVYVINSITIDGASVLAEQVGGGTNLQAIMNGMNQEAQPAADSAQSDVRLAVNDVLFTNGSMTLRSDVFGERSLTIPDFSLKQLGTPQQGLTPNELGQEIATQLIGQVRDAVQDELRSLAVDAAKEKVQEKIDEGIDKIKGLFKRD